MSHVPARLIVVAALVASPVLADTVVLRDGRRIQGDLISVRGGSVRFEERQGDRVLRSWDLARADVQRIELEPGSWSGPPPREKPAPGDERWEPSDRRDQPAGGRSEPGREPDDEGEPADEGPVVEVRGDRPWTDTGLDVRSGGELVIEAEGEVQWGLLSTNGPDGDESSTQHPRSFPLPGHPGGALIGRIGRGRPFYVGSGGEPIRLRESGRLYLGINDDKLDDNSGAYEVRIQY
jgi:hypothetical protein